MAVKNDGVLYPTDAIISRKCRKHYKVPVKSQHWQLRSLISANTIDKQHVVYFPGGHGSNHVQRLNTTTHECETIKLLSFAPRCLVAGNGWLCCGSEHGDFVAVRLDDSHDEPTDRSPPHTLDPDARLPLTLSRNLDQQLYSVLSTSRRSQKTTMAKSMKMANDRVNCVTLWFPSQAAETFGPTVYTEPIAILANNDKTVTCVSLPEFDRREKTEPIEVIEYPDFVNRAIISPDGSMLIAILDDPFLYVHVRAHKYTVGGCRWEQRNRIMLQSQSKTDKSDSRGSFAACFSSSGAYLAVGTQHGTISVFDASLLTNLDANPLITTFESSRPNSGPGAIRDMAFCPGPFDILAWTEDRGHVGVADVRSRFRSRQIIDINVDAEFDHINILDRNTIDPRLLEARAERRDSQRLAPGREASRRDPENSDAINRPLNTHETTVLEAIQVDRRRQRERASALRNIAATARGTDNSPTPPGDPWDSEQPRSRERSSSTGLGVGELLGNYRDQRERAQERVRTTRQLIREANDRGVAGRRPDQRWVERIGDTVAALRDRDRQDASYLSVLEILQRHEREPDRDDTTLLLPLVNHVTVGWEESAMRGTLAADHGVFEVPPSPDNTSGLSWSRDGRTLFVGAQNGIYEFRMDVLSRKLYPSLEMS